MWSSMPQKESCLPRTLDTNSCRSAWGLSGEFKGKVFVLQVSYPPSVLPCVPTLAWAPVFSKILELKINAICFSMKEELSLEKLKGTKLWITAGPREKFTASEVMYQKRMRTSQLHTTCCSFPYYRSCCPWIVVMTRWHVLLLNSVLSFS